MQAADAPAWIGAILLIGGIVVTVAVSPIIGPVVAVIGAAILFLMRDREDGEGEAG